MYICCITFKSLRESPLITPDSVGMPDWMDGKSIVNVVKHTINDTEMAGG
uniref:Uncharacterized protein n=1 Tax=Picea glauca TaxID=3330 RepID=A0A101M1C8_PICGL|nr:hypothetical protein ABT39_MTgene3790 [Picea glauca]